MTRAGTLGADQAPILVEAQSGCGDAAPSGDLADREKLRHATSEAQLRLDFKLT
jgi:hypothetical protein